jgi:hypothetical protein
MQGVSEMKKNQLLLLMLCLVFPFSLFSACNKGQAFEGELRIFLSIGGIAGIGAPTISVPIGYLVTNDRAYKLVFSPKTELHIENSSNVNAVTIPGPEGLGDVTLCSGATYRVRGPISDTDEIFQEMPVKTMQLTYFEFLRPATKSVPALFGLT